MRKIKQMRVLMSVTFMVSVFAGCAADNVQDNVMHKMQTQESRTEEIEIESLTNNFESIEVSELDSQESEMLETETEIATDYYGAVEMSELDYNSFRDRMTDEEWEGFEQYFPIIRENVPFYYADGVDFPDLNKDGEPAKKNEYVMFTRYTPKEVTDITHYLKEFADDGIKERLICNISVFDLDGDGVQELILETAPGTMFLILHHENEDFYGWEVGYRGFESLQTNGVYIGSSGAGANIWMCIRFDNGNWLEERLAEEDWGDYYLHGEAVDEDTFRKQIDNYGVEDVIGYEPKRRTYGE
ncbi:MAG: hypothetical protein K2M91_11535 [Lachnospiraceae bacterium]|nr:hypothetical protein [Lachnospiraceae bacterium]